MLERFAYKIALSIKRASNNEHANTDVLVFGLIILSNTLLIIAICLILGYITEHLLEVITALFSFAILRAVSGGYHLKSSLLCILFTILITIVIAFLELSSTQTIFITLIALVLVAFFAPTDIEMQSRIPRKYYPLLKIISLLLVSSNLILCNSAVALAFLSQSLSLVRRWKT